MSGKVAMLIQKMAAPSRKTRESKQNQREIFENIKLLTKEVIQSRKNINHIIDIQINLEVCCLMCYHVFITPYTFSR